MLLLTKILRYRHFFYSAGGCVPPGARTCDRHQWVAHENGTGTIRLNHRGTEARGGGAHPGRSTRGQPHGTRPGRGAGGRAEAGVAERQVESFRAPPRPRRGCRVERHNVSYALHIVPERVLYTLYGVRKHMHIASCQNVLKRAWRNGKSKASVRRLARGEERRQGEPQLVYHGQRS